MRKIFGYIKKCLCGVNGLLSILYFIFSFSAYAYTVQENQVIFLRWVVFVIVMALFACPFLLRSAKILIIPHSEDLSFQKNWALKWKIAFFSVPFLLFLLKYFIYYPTAMSSDSFEQYAQAVTNQYNDWHPVIQTLISIKIPLLITGGWIGSITLSQIILYSSVLAYSLTSILKYTNIKYTIIALLFVMFNPQTTNMAMYPWKDTLFAIASLLLMTYALHIYSSSGNWIRKPINMALFIVVIAITTLVRHNAVLFTVPLLFAVMFCIAKRRALIICISVAFLIAGIKVPLYSVLGVTSPDSRQVETLGLPLSIIGAVVKYAPEQLDPETREFAYQFANEDVWEDKYNYEGGFNSVKWEQRMNWNVIEEYGSQKVLSMAFRCTINAPKVAFKQIIKLTDVVYTVCDDYIYYEMPGIVINKQGITQQGSPLLQDLNAKVTYFIYVLFPWLFMYVGVMHFVLIIGVLAKYKLNKWSAWKNIFFILPVFFYNFGTTLLLSGPGDSSRFFFYTFLLMPTLLVLLFNIKTTKGERA